MRCLSTCVLEGQGIRKPPAVLRCQKLRRDCFLISLFYLAPQSSFVHAEHEIAVIADLLTYYAWLFGVTDEEMAKEREKELKYQEGLSKIRAAQALEVSHSYIVCLEY